MCFEENILLTIKSNAKGRKPIEKNIVVVDEQGNIYKATYPKRAKGLVKNGRARFVDENTICLACPPNIILEENIMSENKVTGEYTTAESFTKGINEEFAKNSNVDVGKIIQDATENQVPKEKLSMNYVLEQIEQLSKDKQYLYDTIQKLGEMANANGPGDIVGANKAEALGNIVQSREMTNLQLLRIYEKMYEDLKPKEASVESDIAKFKQLSDSLCRLPNDFVFPILQKAAQQMFVVAGAEIVK